MVVSATLAKVSSLSLFVSSIVNDLADNHYSWLNIPPNKQYLRNHSYDGIAIIDFFHQLSNQSHIENEFASSNGAISVHSSKFINERAHENYRY